MTAPKPSSTRPQVAMIYSIHRTEDWWRHVGKHLGYDSVTVLSDRRGRGDRWVTDDYYRAYRRFYAARADRSENLSNAELRDVVARDRVLRWQPPRRAYAMALAMAEAMESALVSVKPDVLISFPIDNFVQDVLSRRARAHGVVHFELTASALPDMCMLMHRGRLITAQADPDADVIEAKVQEVAAPLFTPAYVQNQPAYTSARFLKILAYFHVRAVFFRLYSWWRRDWLNTHYLDARMNLGHKAKLRDLRITQLTEPDWEVRLEAFPRERRVMFGLQLFPEAAIDYWLEDLGLIEHERVLLQTAEALSQAGFLILVKDHPLQFGFRRTEFITALLQLENVVLVPYDVSGNVLMSRCGVSFTATGTLGLQSALLGDRSIVGLAYYANEEDFILVRTTDDLADLPTRIANSAEPQTLRARQFRIIANLLKGSFEADFFSYRNFDPTSPAPAATELGQRLGAQVRLLGPQGEAWHEATLPKGGGAHDGSPLN